MDEQVLIKTIQAMSQEIAQIVIDKNLFKAELEQAREEIVSVETLEEPMEEITVEDLRRENEELKARLERLESLLG